MTMQITVMTVTGPVSANELGVVLPHEHVFTNTMREYRGNGLLHDIGLAVEELKDFRRPGRPDPSRAHHERGRAFP